MRKLVFLFVGLILALGLGVAVALNTSTGQNLLLERGMAAALGASSTVPEGLRVVICGSASPLGNVPERAQACIAVLTKDHFLLFDVGARSPLRIAQARLPAGRLDGVFLTHFHSDHISALPDVNLASWVQGRKESLQVFGPPGVERVVAGFNTAFGLDNSYRTAHHGNDLLPAAAGPMRAIPIAPGTVAWEHLGLRVTSFLVDHAPVAPAVGYRIDYRGRSVVISGDTNATDSLFAAAQDADLVLHDALSRALLDPMISAASEFRTPVPSQIMTDVIDYHADSLSLEARAKAAGVKQLAYYHLVPAPANSLAEAIFKRGLAADTLVVKDLHRFDLPPDSDQLLITAP